jgi:hypothetical protein
MHHNMYPSVYLPTKYPTTLKKDNTKRINNRVFVNFLLPNELFFRKNNTHQNELAIYGNKLSQIIIHIIDPIQYQLIIKPIKKIRSADKTITNLDNFAATKN